MAFQNPVEISVDAYREHCRQAGSSPNVTLTADIDCDAKTLVVETELGELRYPLDTVVKAVKAAYRKQGLRAEGYQARLMEQLDRADDDLRHFKADLELIESENVRNAYERSQAGLRQELDQEAPSAGVGPGQDGGAPETIDGPELRT